MINNLYYLQVRVGDQFAVVVASEDIEELKPLAQQWVDDVYANELVITQWVDDAYDRCLYYKLISNGKTVVQIQFIEEPLKMLNRCVEMGHKLKALVAR